MTEPTAEHAKYAKSFPERVFHFLRIPRISRFFSLLGLRFRRRRLAFRKYQVAPRLGARAVQRRVLLRLGDRDTSPSGELETATEA